jgi:hypothetical protein
MQPTPKMKEVIEAIGKKFGVDFSIVGTCLRLDMPHYDCLCIEKVDRYRIGIAHYYESGGYTIPEPYVLLFTKYQMEFGWIPIEITQSMTGNISYVVMTDDGNGIKRYDEKGQAGLAEFTEQWAQNILDQGWLENSVLRIVDTLVQLPAALESSTPGVWPEPTTDEPDRETLQEQVSNGGGCEATDGCWVEPDGVCVHGHPSWLLRLGII